MSLSYISTFLAMSPPTQPGQPASLIWINMVPLVLLVVVFYFALIRPQQKKQKQQAELLKAVKSNDRILTNSGIIATVITVKDKSITIHSTDAKFEITKSAV